MYVFIYLTLIIKHLQWTRNHILFFKKFKAVKCGSRWEVTQKQQEKSKLLTLQILPCSSAKGQNSNNQEKPQNGDTPAKDQEKEHKRASLEEQTGNKMRLCPWPHPVHEGTRAAHRACRSTTLPTNLVLDPWLLFLHQLKKSKTKFFGIYIYCPNDFVV